MSASINQSSFLNDGDILGGKMNISRWKLKECPRCGGDIFMDIEENGWLGHCLQCGYMGQQCNAMEEPAAANSGMQRSIRVSPSAEGFTRSQGGAG
jgi:ribosomal protein S27AE